MSVQPSIGCGSGTFENANVPLYHCTTPFLLSFSTLILWDFHIFFDEAEYRAYREELAAYDDFVASLDMDD